MTRAAFFLFVIASTLLLPSKAQAWWDDAWSSRQKVTLDAGATGVALAEDAGRIPVLIRLHDGDFDFAQAQPDGHDIRIIDGQDKTPLKFQIEQWNSKAGIGLIWADISNVKAGATTTLYIYSGNAKATAPDSGGFDADVVLAYHFDQTTGAAKDSSGNGNNARGAVSSVADAAIGSGAQFDGTSSLSIPASSSLAFQAGAQFTFSTWIRLEKPGANQSLYASADNALVIGLNQGTPFVKTALGQDSVAAAIPSGDWHHLAVVIADRTTFYLDGKPVSTGNVTLPALTGAAALGNGFIGALDEVEISKVARSSGYIGALYATQTGPDNRFASLDEEEKAPSWNGGYFGVILRSVTIDGWVVIGILGVMSVISWIVMVQKTRQIQQIARANIQFIKLFNSMGSEFTSEGTRALEGQSKKIGASSLFRIYDEGIIELRRRIGEALMSQIVLSPQSILAIKASLDRISTREGQRLNAGIVLLTIAISGGPFVGLFGTVVGVMITFAAIAASGDVNVNAIAPGIAAALVATCAGMAVAIPSLFGYNYLLVRIKDLTADMNVFIDEFSTKLAEQFSPEDAISMRAAE